ncbi:MAG: DUF5060 domain-containing protein [Phycisphaerae bacterium]|nr:DUF5060 domain-containing protein [Phycisphaerae bacterium]
MRTLSIATILVVLLWTATSFAAEGEHIYEGSNLPDAPAFGNNVWGLWAGVSSGLNASTVTERMDLVKTHLATTHARCEIRDVRLSVASVSCFEKLEVTFRLAASYANPYDPDDIRVDATITFPDGSVVTAPAFYSEPFRPDRGVAQMMLWVPYESAGTPCWKVRFAPPLPGEYSLSLVATQRDGQRATYGPLRFIATPSAHPGFVQVSRDNPRYFETSGDGRLFWGTGSNVAWTRDSDPGDPHPCYEYYFGKAAGYTNATRVWLCHWAWLEWTPAVDAPGTNWEGYGGIGIYNQMIADALDRIFLLAEKNGLRIMLVTEDNNESMQNGENDGWAANPYNRVHGGPCQAPVDVFSSPEARRYYRNRLRYIVARWGYSTSLWAINSWNDCSHPTPVILDWLREMRDLTQQLTEGYRPLIYGSNYRHEASTLMDYAHSGADAPQDRPRVDQECYYTERAEGFAEMLRDELWTALASGHAAVMVWPHALVDNTDSWHAFEPVMRAAQSLPLNRGTWRSIRARVEQAESAERKPPVRLYSVRPYGDVPDWGAKATQNRFTISRDKSVQWLQGAGVKLYGDRNGRREWRNPPTFAVDFPTPARLLVEVDEIGSGDQTLCFSVDGRETMSVELRGGRRYPEGEERWVEAPFDAGPHEIRVENGRPGADWISIRRYCFVVETKRVADLVDVRGLQSDTHGLVYLRNQTDSDLYREVLGQAPVLLTDVQLCIDGVAPGCYEVTRLDTRTTSAQESRTQESRDGTLELDLGELRHDAVVRFARTRYALATTTHEETKRDNNRIQTCRDNPRYWQYKDNPVLLLGGSVEDNLFQIPELEEHLDLLESVGGNYVRNTMSSRDEGNVWPFAEEGSMYDLNKPNVEYWRRFENMLELTSEREIIVQIELWDRFDFACDHWNRNPYNPKNNINYTAEESGLKETITTHPGKRESAFFRSVPALENNGVVLRYQQAQVDKMLSISLQYGNVLYCMDNETNESSEWGAYWSNYIKEKAAEAGVVAHATEMWDAYDLMDDHHKRTYDHPEIYSFCDISQNNHNRGQKHWDNIEKVRVYLTPIRPINSVKIYGSDEPYRIAPPGARDGVGGRYGRDRDGLERFWRQIFGGMASSRFHRPTSGLGLTEKAQAHIKSMRMLTGKMDIFTCEPHNDLLSNRKENGAYVIANPGKEYAVYFPNGDPVALDLSAVQGRMKAGWLDIAQSQWAKEETLEGGGTVTLSPPGTGHWAVWIGPVSTSQEVL